MDSNIYLTLVAVLVIITLYAFIRHIKKIRSGQIISQRMTHKKNRHFRTFL